MQARTRTLISLYITQYCMHAWYFRSFIIFAPPYLHMLCFYQQQQIITKREMGPQPKCHQNPTGDHFEDSGGIQESDDDVLASFIGNDVTAEVEGRQREFWEDYYTNIDHDDINYCDDDEAFMTDFLLRGGESDYCDNVGLSPEMENIMAIPELLEGNHNVGWSQDIENIMTIPDALYGNHDAIHSDDVDYCDTSLLSKLGEDHSIFDLDFATSSPGSPEVVSGDRGDDPMIDLDFATCYPGRPEMLSDLSEDDSIIDLDFAMCSPRFPETESILLDDVSPTNRRPFVRFDDAPLSFPSTPGVHKNASRMHAPVPASRIPSPDRYVAPRSILRRRRIEPESLVPTTRRRTSDTRLEDPSEHDCRLTLTSDGGGFSQMRHTPPSLRLCTSEERMPSVSSDNHRRRECRPWGVRRDAMSERERESRVRHTGSLQENITREEDEHATYGNPRIHRRR